MKLRQTIHCMLNMKPLPWRLFKRSLQLSCVLLLCAAALLHECGGDLLAHYRLYITAQALNECAQSSLLIALLLSVCLEELLP